MNKIIKFITVIAVLASVPVSCNKNAGSGLSPEKIGLDIRLNGIVSETSEAEMATKAEELQTEEEKTISLLTIAVYNSSDRLEWTREYEGARSSRYTVTGLTAGSKKIVVIANKKVAIPETLSPVYDMVSDLSDNTRDNFVMFGIGSAIADYDPKPAIVNISRLAAKFRVFGGIKTQWEIDAPEYFDILNIYVANAGGHITLEGKDSGPNYNLRTEEAFTEDDVVRNLTVASKANWTTGEAFNGGTALYAYPNSDAKLRTAVIIKAKFNDRVCYYPMVIDQPIESNHMYNFGNIVITCEGSPNPWTDFEKVKINYSIEITDWINVPLDKDITF